MVILPVLFTAQACDVLFGPGTPAGPGGVFASVDSGETWEQGKSLGKFNLAATHVHRVFVEGDKPKNILAAGTGSGVLVSEDNGRSWQVLFPEVNANDVFINPNNDEEIFVGGASGGGLAAIFKSADRGGAWVQVYNEPVDKITVTGMAFDRVNSRTLFAGLSSGTVLQSVDSGNKWTALADFEGRVIDIAVGRNVLFVLNSGALHRSTDGGRTWVTVPVEGAGQFSAMHMDNLDNGYVILASTNGLHRSLDGGITWAKLITLPSAPEISNVTAVSVNPSKRTQIFAAIRSTVYRSDDSGATWKTSKLPTAKTIFDLVIDPIEPNRVYAGLK